jgi:hypothetical protein
MGRYTAAVRDHLILPALVSLPAGEERLRRGAGQRVPAPVSLRLLIDTGSRRTTLIPGVVRHLDPPAGVEVELVTPLASVAATLYWVRLAFPEAGLAPFDPVQVARLPMPAQLSQFHGLLGRDLLGRLELFEYHGRRGYYSLRDAPGWLGWLRRWL